MNNQYTVLLNKVRLAGRHGVYPEERITGGQFELDIACDFIHNGVVNRLEETVDYEAVFALVKKRFDEPTPLLETLAAEMAALIRKQYSFLSGISISIIKLNPPIASFQGSTGVCFSTHYI